MEQEEKGQGEIIIVRRSRGGEEDHHGGVWKIAFADFMTAMMAFFLVMWLVNASNEKTKKAVASYFNPIKLTDTTTNSKGVNNPKYGVDDPENKDESETTTIDTPAKIEIKLSTEEKRFEEQALFVDPYAILAEIESGVGGEQSSDNELSSTNAGEGSSLEKGVSFQDPFDPNSWDSNNQATTPEPSEDIPEDDNIASLSGETDQQDGLGMMNGEQDTFEEINEADLNIEKNEPEVVETEPEVETAEASEESQQETLDASSQASSEQSMPVDEEASKASETEADNDEIPEAIEQVKADIKERLEAALTESKLTGLDVEVTAKSDGVIVVLSDNNRNGMFSIGSAKPTSELVKTMSKLGEVISEQNGKIEISGHTDARPYQSENYDNWRLSSARAHMAYYMLVRGGMAEARVQKIVGQAAVNLKDTQNPNAAANRRIEVLIKPQT